MVPVTKPTAIAGHSEWPRQAAGAAHTARSQQGVLSEGFSPSAQPADRVRQTDKRSVWARAYAVASRRCIRAPVRPPLQLLTGRENNRCAVGERPPRQRQ